MKNVFPARVVNDLVPWLSSFLVCLMVGVTVLAEKGKQNPGNHNLPTDSRYGKPIDLNGYFPFVPPPTLRIWQGRRQELREQVLVATGLWPMPEKTPLNPVIHGKIDRGDYTIEKVFFASYPGHYVSGNLYRPKGKTGKLPAVLSPHGHWADGRLNDQQASQSAGIKYLQDQIKCGAEKTLEGARFPLQARCAQLARMGCIVFQYDMVGYADSQQIKHRIGFTDVEAELRLQSFMGLQTFNSIRALDFLLGLPDVDPNRIGVTGASGGGTQTFILCAIDDRPAVAFPAVMVSTAMQGGCVCENCSYLRQGTGNVELAGLMAPKPLGMTGAHDWTEEIESKGFPELKTLYRLYDSQDQVMARCFPQFEHNYNQVSREVMYNWFNKYLKLEQPNPVLERPFVPVAPRDLSVYDDKHPRPLDATGVESLRHTMSELSDRQMAAIYPKDEQTLKEFRRIVGSALQVMIHDRLPKPDQIEMNKLSQKRLEKVHVENWVLGRKGLGEKVPALFLCPDEFNGTIVVWIHPSGKESLMNGSVLQPAARLILDRKAAILAPDVFLTGEFENFPPAEVNSTYAGFTFGYNRPLLANRIHDILSVIAFAQGHEGAKSILLLGLEKAGPWTLLTSSLCREGITKTGVDLNRFQFESVKTTNDEMMLPGGLKYGGLLGFAALCAPHPLFLHNLPSKQSINLVEDAYKAADFKDNLVRKQGAMHAEDVVNWLLP